MIIFFQAVCCDDHVHCCPNGYTCEVSKGTCQKGDLQTEWFVKTSAIQVNAVKCSDGQSECPDGNTCCKTSSGQYGCCPLPKVNRFVANTDGLFIVFAVKASLISDNMQCKDKSSLLVSIPQ